MDLEKNVGDFEAVVRGVIGAGALAIGVSQRNPLWLALSVLTFATAVSRFCPINAGAGKNTYTADEVPPVLQAVPTIH